MKKRIWYVSILFMSISQLAQAQELKSLIKQSLLIAPELRKAEADLQASNDRVEQAKSLHYPTVNLKANQFMTEWHRDKDDNAEHKFEPSVEVGLNLYSFGAIETEVDKRQAEEKYYQQHYIEQKSDLVYQIAELYLNALDAKEQIKVLKKSLLRHKKFVREMEVIVKHDKGRRSELVQAQARMILVEQKINIQRRLLQTNLNTLAKFTRKPFSSADLVVPFKNITKAKLQKNYSIKNYKLHPSYLAGLQNLKTKDYEYKAAKKSNLPKIDLVGNVGRDDRAVSIQFRWDFYNRQNSYNVSEKSHLRTISQQDLEILVLNLQEMANQSLINLSSLSQELKILKRQIRANIKVADFNRLQFKVGRKSLFEVLMAENDLSEVQLGYVNAKHAYYQAILDYFRSQGTLLKWVN